MLLLSRDALGTSVIEHIELVADVKHGSSMMHVCISVDITVDIERRSLVELMMVYMTVLS